jgi:hypothetical protein
MLVFGAPTTFESEVEIPARCRKISIYRPNRAKSASASDRVRPQGGQGSPQDQRSAARTYQEKEEAKPLMPDSLRPQEDVITFRSFKRRSRTALCGCAQGFPATIGNAGLPWTVGYPLRIGRSAGISSLMKSKKAATAGARRLSG